MTGFPRRLSALALAALAMLVTSGCTQHEPPPPIKSESGEIWTVVVREPRFDGADTCGTDPAVRIAVMSTDMPASSYGIELRAGATKADANRIAECLRESLASGTITVSGPQE